MTFQIEKCSLDELKMLREVLGSKQLQRKVDAEYERRLENRDSLTQNRYRSSRLPNYDFRYFRKCNQLCFDFDIMRLGLVWSESCFSGNANRGGNFYPGIFGIDSGDASFRVRHNLAYLASLFEEDSVRKDYECAYNTVNFIINGIYKSVSEKLGDVESVDDLFHDFSLKQEVVCNQLPNIALYLRDIIAKVPDSRLSVGSYILTHGVSTSGKAPKVQGLVEALTFGCSMDELRQGNYEGAKRLIYVPENKMRK